MCGKCGDVFIGILFAELASGLCSTAMNVTRRCHESSKRYNTYGKHTMARAWAVPISPHTKFRPRSPMLRRYRANMSPWRQRTQIGREHTLTPQIGPYV